jgi:hypothetical protein
VIDEMHEMTMFGTPDQAVRTETLNVIDCA